MNLKHEFNRIGHLVNGGAGRTQRAAGAWMEKQGNGMVRRVRNGVDTQARTLLTFEEKIVEHVRSNPGLYLFGIALLIGALVAKLLMESRAVRPVPLL